MFFFVFVIVVFFFLFFSFFFVFLQICTRFVYVSVNDCMLVTLLLDEMKYLLCAPKKKKLLLLTLLLFHIIHWRSCRKKKNSPLFLPHPLSPPIDRV